MKTFKNINKTIFNWNWILTFLLIINYSANLFPQNKSCVKIWDSISHSEIYEFVEITPEPSKGQDRLHKELRKVIKLDTIPENISSIMALVAFIVCPDGSITGERILFDNTNKIGYQMIKISKEFKWKAGTCGNKKVPVLYQIPLIACFR